ncbi:MAG TPA: glycosyltransferase family 2 protein [Patescibacteria group bacterium]
MKLSIISLNYKKPDLTIACIKSLLKVYGKYFEEKQWEYIVVDNNSEDDSALKIKKEIEGKEGLHFLQNPKNSGFGAGNNLGAQKAKGEYILFLNNDTTIQGQGIKDMLLYMQEHPEIPILGGELKNENGTPQVSSGKFYTILSFTFLLLGMQKFGLVDKNPTKITRVDWVKGALLMIRKHVFEKLGGFDENIFMYTEDMELCYRAAKMGYFSYFFPTDGILHKDQGSSNRTFAVVNIYKNMLYFYKKHRPFWEYFIVKSLLQTKAIILILYGKLFKKEYFVVTYEKALEMVR